MKERSEAVVMHLTLGGVARRKTCQNSFGRPAKRSTAKKRTTSLGLDDPDFVTFYSMTNGMTLYWSETDNTDDDAYFVPPIKLHPLEHIRRETAHFNEWLEPEDRRECPVYDGAICIGEPPGTGNHFIYVTHGRHLGKIFYFDHDPDRDWHKIPFAKSLADFISCVTMPPYRGIKNTCGASRVWF